jgi:excisionase family DNA binding protein
MELTEQPILESLLTPEQVAKTLAIPRREVLDLARSGKLKCTKLSYKRPRFRTKDLLEFIESKSTKQETV